MIDGADFLKWCQVFNVHTGSNPPTNVTLQLAYNNGNGQILETGSKPIVFQDYAGSPSNSSILELFSTTRGSRPFPPMTTAQRNAISSPVNGLMIFNTDTGQINYWNSLSSSWIAVDAASDGFLQIDNNLSDVQSTQQSLINLGIAANPALAFVQNVTVTNPPPRLVYGNATTSGGSIKLPPAQGSGALNIGQVITLALTQPSNPVDVLDSSGALLFALQEGVSITLALNDNSTSQGSWVFASFYPFMTSGNILMGDSFGVMTVGSLLSGTGINVDSSVDEQITISSTTTLQNAYDNGNGSILETGTKPVVLKDITATGNNSSLFDLFSTTKGSRPYPSLTTSQRNLITSPPIGLSVYNSTTNTIDYYDGTAWQTSLTIDNLLAGSNITITNNGDGTVTISSSGSGPGGNANYSGWSFAGNTNDTTFAAINTFYPITILSSSFIDIISSDFVNQVSSIAGVNTPNFKYIGSSTQYFTVNINLSVLGTVNTLIQYEFAIFIKRAGGSLVFTQFLDIINIQDFVTTHAISLSGIIQLNTGDEVYIAVSSNTLDNITVFSGNATIVNVDATEQTAMVWNNVTSPSASMSPNNGYVTNNTSQVVLTMPTVANFGSEIQITGGTSGISGWQILLNSGQYINVGSMQTTINSGSVTSTQQFDSVILRCVVANTVWNAYGIQGNLTVV